MPFCLCSTRDASDDEEKFAILASFCGDRIGAQVLQGVAIILRGDCAKLAEFSFFLLVPNFLPRGNQRALTLMVIIHTFNYGL